MTNETNEERNETFVLRKLDGIAQWTADVGGRRIRRPYGPPSTRPGGVPLRRARVPE